jgi:undecaprenyl-diphosphatase
MGHSAFDLYVLHLVNGFAGRPLLDEIVQILASNPLPRVAVLAIPYVILWQVHKDDKSRAKLIAALFGPLLAIAVARLLSVAFPFEVRPMYAHISGFHALAVTDQVDIESYSAFPSDTSAYAIAFTLGLVPVNRIAGLAITLLSMVMFSLSRIYLGAHYPSDVLVGWVIGVACFALTTLPVARRAGAAVLRLESNHQAAFYSIGLLSLYELGEVLYNVRKFFHFLHFLH